MRTILRLAAGAVVLGALGCSAPSGTQEATQTEPQPVVVQSEVCVTIGPQPVVMARRCDPYLLFDRCPSPMYSPQYFAGRREWPVAERGYSGGQWVEFEALLIDREQGFDQGNDFTYRRFYSRRRGVNFR
jgi:hypothetical protein